MMLNALRSARNHFTRALVTAALAAIPLCAQTQGALQICKIAGTGVTPGTNFLYNVSGVGPVNVIAGTAVTPGCNSVVATGTVTVTETLQPGVSVTAITVASNGTPVSGIGMLVSEDFTTGTATVTVPANTTTTVTFTNTASTNLSGLQVCKAAGPGITNGSPFNFAVTGTGINQPLTVNAGSCSTTLLLPPGTVLTVHENAPAGATVSAISGGTIADVIAASIVKTLGAAGTTTQVTFTNKALAAQGCSPGYFKNHLSGPLATTTVGTFFTGLPASFANETLDTALQGGGGPGVSGGQQILLRAAVAALLNTLNANVQYPLTAAQVIAMVNTAIASGDRSTMLALADQLDAANNGAGGCPLN